MNTPAKWTATLVGRMHLANVTSKQLAEAADLNPKYLSAILNGHVSPKGAKEKLNAAFETIVSGEVEK